MEFLGFYYFNIRIYCNIDYVFLVNMRNFILIDFIFKDFYIILGCEDMEISVEDDERIFIMVEDLCSEDVYVVENLSCCLFVLLVDDDRDVVVVLLVDIFSKIVKENKEKVFIELEEVMKKFIVVNVGLGEFFII